MCSYWKIFHCLPIALCFCLLCFSKEHTHDWKHTHQPAIADLWFLFQEKRNEFMQEIFNTLTFRRLWWGRCYKLGLAFAGVVQLLTRVQLIETLCNAAYQAPLFFTISHSLLKFMSVESVTLSNHLLLCQPVLLLLSVFRSIRFSAIYMPKTGNGGKYIRTQLVSPPQGQPRHFND